MPTPRSIAQGRLDELLAELARNDIALPAPLHLTARDTLHEVTLFLSPREPLTDLPADLPAIEADILEALGRQQMGARQIAELAGYRLNSHFRGVLARMRRRGLLNHDRRGYYRAPRQR